MKRTNIVLEEWQHQYLKDRAEREGKSISAIVRELIETSMRPHKDGIKDDPIFKIVGMFKGKKKKQDICRRHDEIIYRKDWG